MELNNEDQTLKILQDLANKLNLKWDNKDFSFLSVAPEEFYSLIFLTNFNDFYFKEFGETVEDRLKNLDEFIKSEHFKKIKKGVAGTTVYNKSAKLDLIQKKFPDLYLKINLIFQNVNSLALIYSHPKLENTSKFYRLLLHEYIHILLRQNNNDLREKKEKVIGLIESLIGTKKLANESELIQKYKDVEIIQKLTQKNK